MPFRYHDRRRRPVRVRGPVRRREDRRRVGAVGHDPHHHRQRGLGAGDITGMPPLLRWGWTRRRRGWRAATSSCSGRSPPSGRRWRPRPRLSTRPGSKVQSSSSRLRPKLRRHADPPDLPHCPVPARASPRPRARSSSPARGWPGVELQDCQQRVIDVIGPPDRTFGKQDVFGFVSTYRDNARGLKLEFRRGPGAVPRPELDPHHQGRGADEGGRRQGHAAQDVAEEAQGREVPHLQAAEADPHLAGSARSRRRSRSPSSGSTRRAASNNVRVATVID